MSQHKESCLLACKAVGYEVRDGGKGDTPFTVQVDDGPQTPANNWSEIRCAAGNSTNVIVRVISKAIRQTVVWPSSVWVCDWCGGHSRYSEGQHVGAFFVCSDDCAACVKDFT